MELRMFTVLAITLLVLAMPVYGQITSLCTGAMLRSFSPCMNFVTNLGGGGSSSPTQDCCTALRYLMGNGTDCLCLIATGGVPFSVPVNRNIAMSLPKACKMPGVPIECKAHGSPLPAPGPDANEFPSPSPRGSTTPEPRSPPLAPEGNTVPGLTPPGGSPGGGSLPGLTPPGLTPGGGSIPGLTPPDDLTPPLTPPGTRPTLSAAQPSQKFSSMLLLALCGALTLKYY